VPVAETSSATGTSFVAGSLSLAAAAEGLLRAVNSSLALPTPPNHTIGFFSFQLWLFSYGFSAMAF
jgi:hypothetical protein